MKMFTHDCPSCRYLGSDNANDHYVCTTGREPDLHCLIARHSSEGSDYSAAPVCMVRRYSNDSGYCLVKTLKLYEGTPLA